MSEQDKQAEIETFKELIQFNHWQQSIQHTLADITLIQSEIYN